MKAVFRLTTLALVASMAGTAAARAQDAPPPANTGARATHAPPSPQQQVARLTRRLQLTPDQASKIGAILQQRRDQLAALRSQGGGGGGQARAITQNSERQLRAALTDSQRQEYDQWREQMLEKRMQANQGMMQDNSVAPASH